MVFGEFPSYNKEFFLAPDGIKASIGPGLLASPFVWAFSLIDRLSGADIVNIRTLNNIQHSWSLFGFIFATHFYFCLGCLILFRCLRPHLGEKFVLWSIGLMVLAQGIPIYVFQRPVSSHAYEFFLQCLLAVFLVRTHLKHKPPRGIRDILLIGVAVACVFLVRYNNAVLALIWPLVIFWEEARDLKSGAFWLRIGAVFLIAGGLIFCFKIFPAYFTVVKNYPLAVKALTTVHAPTFYVRRFIHIVFGIDWGLLYTAPFVLIGMGALFVLRYPMKRHMLILMLAGLINLYVAIIWKTQGGFYGYRYFVTSVIPLVVYPFGVFLRRLEARFGEKGWRIIFLLALFPVLSMISFTGNESNLMFGPAEQYFGQPGPGNDTFQMEIWEMLLFTPQDLLPVVLRGGPFYLIHVFCVLFECTEILPNVIYIRYPVFSGWVFLKIGLLYACPFYVFALVGWRKKART